MIKISREELVKTKGKIDIPEIKIDVEQLSNLDLIVSTLIDLLVSKSSKESYE